MKTKLVNLDEWLREHSVKTEKRGPEIVFTHNTGETSILVSREAHSMPMVEVSLEPLASFYRKYSGASIGNSQILIGTNVAGGIQISHGLRLADLNRMLINARELKIPIGGGEIVFMAEADWMFVYTMVEELGQTVLRTGKGSVLTFYTLRVVVVPLGCLRNGSQAQNRVSRRALPHHEPRGSPRTHFQR